MLALLASSPVGLLLRPGPLLHEPTTITTTSVIARLGPSPTASAASPTVRDQMMA